MTSVRRLKLLLLDWTAYCSRTAAVATSRSIVIDVYGITRYLHPAHHNPHQTQSTLLEQRTVSFHCTRTSRWQLTSGIPFADLISATVAVEMGLSRDDVCLQVHENRRQEIYPILPMQKISFNPSTAPLRRVSSLALDLAATGSLLSKINRIDTTPTSAVPVAQAGLTSAGD
ncbi:hypothetical protein BT96DRAFT_606444 [Gymnopus androsaceus JB14]|uniref:Uncharacterized protein n=1 Tax=Gymnopus androsaceus JB14 TaxID=1447944 RepID=A0A6A4HU92_9AGAR|nr:hypothetical protein BT96DRAFT_606444 [Gymnopus androsaceus JB14]